jgi:hypothetical protein
MTVKMFKARLIAKIPPWRPPESFRGGRDKKRVFSVKYAYIAN